LGISESNNVFVIVVSEETGRISTAQNGILTSGLTIQKLRSEMEAQLGERPVDGDELSFSTAES
jgi:diadenylate cyclase